MKLCFPPQAPNRRVLTRRRTEGPRYSSHAETRSSDRQDRITTFEQAVSVRERLRPARCAGSRQDVVKVRSSPAGFSDFAAMNGVCARYVTEPYPARTTVHSQIGQSLIAVDCVASLPRR